MIKTLTSTAKLALVLSILALTVPEVVDIYQNAQAISSAQDDAPAIIGPLGVHASYAAYLNRGGQSVSF